MELDSMPSRYVQSIYKQYTLFLKDQEAQKAAAAEDMMEELEDGGGFGGSVGSRKSSNSSPVSGDNMVSIREQQLAAIRANIARGEAEGPDQQFVQTNRDDPAIQAAREQQLAKLRADIMTGRTDEVKDD